MLVMAVHSYRGGTGKTLLATNMAAKFKKKKKVCLLDYDLRAPGLNNKFEGEKPDYWVNDLLNGDCDIDECITEVLPNLYVGYGDPDAEAIRDLMGRSRSWESEALKRTVTLKKELSEMGFNKLMFDTSPGLAYSSINAVVASDLIALVMRLDSIDILGTKEMEKGVYELLAKPTFIVVNMVLPPQIEAFEPILKKTFKDKKIAYIPCLCDVRGFIAQGKQILIEEDLDYARAVLKLADEIDAEYG